MIDNQNGVNGESQQNMNQDSNTNVEQPSGPDAVPKQARRKPRTRSDKNRRHAGHKGALSKYPEEALVRRGERRRQLRSLKNKFRADLKPSGEFEDALFDRAWSCYLRLRLIAPADCKILAPENNPANSIESTPSLREDHWPTLVFQDSKLMEKFSPESLGHIVILQRYDSHFSREFFRAIGMLLALRSNRERGSLPRIQKTLTPDILEGDND